MPAFTPNNPPSVVNDSSAVPASALGGAVDLSNLGSTAARAGEEVPNEFSVALAGDTEGRPHVLMAFGHLQWLFEPHLAVDLGSVLLEAAHNAEAVARGEKAPQEVQKP